MIRKHLKKAMKVEPITNKDRQTYVETMIFFMLFLLTLLVVVISASGMILPENTSIDITSPILLDLLVIFIIAQLMIIILILHRIYRNQ